MMPNCMTRYRFLTNTLKCQTAVAPRSEGVLDVQLLFRRVPARRLGLRPADLGAGMKANPSRSLIGMGATSTPTPVTRLHGFG